MPLAVLLALLLLAAVAGGCAAGGEVGDRVQELVSGEYAVLPGEERYVCTTFRSPPEEVGIVEVTQAPGSLVHHVALFQTLADEPNGTFDCPVLIRETWVPIWAAGAGGAGLTLPDGVGFRIDPDTQYLVQYHLLNAADEPVRERSIVRLRYGDDPEALEPAGLFAMGSFDLEIPAGAADHGETVSCAAPRDMHAFAVFPHMHRLGTRLTFETGATEASARTTYEKDPWVFGEQPMEPMDLFIPEGRFLRTSCRWRNDTGEDVGYGESSDDEMCFFVLFYHPSGELDGCFNP
jgi:hypothetical protein